MLNLYLRYFDLTRTAAVVERLRVSLQDAPIDFENVYLVVGDFTGLVQGTSEIEATPAGVGSKLNGFVNGSAAASKMNGNGGVAEAAIMVEDILNDFQYTQMFEANSTSFVDLAHGQEIDDGLNVSHAPPKNIKKSSCNILCRDKLPSVVDPFREAIYRTKSPLDLRKVPSAKDNLLASRRTEKLTGHSNVIREGLCHMAIPRDWTWGGPASDHCPVWIECYKRVEKAILPVMNGRSVAKDIAGAVNGLVESMNGVTLLTLDNAQQQAVVANGAGTAVRKLKRLSTCTNGSGGGGRSLDETELRPVQ